jgi:hypothetical protein
MEYVSCIGWRTLPLLLRNLIVVASGNAKPEPLVRSRASGRRELSLPNNPSDSNLRNGEALKGQLGGIVEEIAEKQQRYPQNEHRHAPSARWDWAPNEGGSRTSRGSRLELD